MNKKVKDNSNFLGNKNAETWTILEATELFNKALELSYLDDYDFIGEIAKELRTYRDIFTYLSDKYTDLKPIYKNILSNLESNCFSHSKKGEIKEATAIMNLKSNYKWTDRNDVSSNGETIKGNTFVIEKTYETNEKTD